MKISEFVQVTRPKTLYASLGPVLIGLSLAGYDSIRSSWPIAALILVTAVLLQISANLVNDYYDFANKVDGKDRLGPKRSTASAISTPQQIRSAYRISLTLSAVAGAFLIARGGTPILIIGLASMLAAFLYTGGPRPLSYYGLGELLALIFFGPIAVWGTWFLMTDRIELLPAIIGLGPGFIAWSLMATNNMRDKASDAKSGKKTLATMTSQKTSRLIVLFGIDMSILLPVYLWLRLDDWRFLIVSFVFLLFIKDWKRISANPIDKEQNKSLVGVSTYLLIYSVLLAAIILITDTR